MRCLFIVFLIVSTYYVVVNDTSKISFYQIKHYTDYKQYLDDCKK